MNNSFNERKLKDLLENDTGLFLDNSDRFAKVQLCI